MNYINSVIDNLVKHSGILYEIIYDNNLHIPGLSFIEKDLRGNDRFKIVINLKMIENENIDVIAHILSHEWGHHMLKHTLKNPILLNENEKINIELEADTYAINFIKKYNYNQENIKEFLKKDLKKNIDDFEKKINFFKKRYELL